MESNLQSRHLNAWVISHIQYAKKRFKNFFKYGSYLNKDALTLGLEKVL